MLRIRKKTSIIYRIGLLMAVFFLANATLVLASEDLATFTPTGSMGTARYGHTATLMPNGKLLIAGGSEINSNSLASAELYDTTTGTFSPTGNMEVARCQHTATLLPNGKVLVVGGSFYYNNGASVITLSSAELYDPVTGTFTATGSLITGRFEHTATLLSSGKVLIAGGGSGSYITTNSAELYDPSTGIFTATGDMVTWRSQHTATLLPCGKVLITGGGNFQIDNILSSAELFDPSTGTFTATGSMGTARYVHTATLLSIGKVLIAGGGGMRPYYPPLSSAELYDQSTGTFTTTGSIVTGASLLTATLLPNGKVLIAGGNVNAYCLARAELYDPATETFTTTGSMATARNQHTATLLPSGKVLIAGGNNYQVFGPLSSAELYRPECTTPPVISGLTPSPAVLWPPNKKMVLVTISAIASDNCDPSPVTKIISVSSNEPANSNAVATGEAVITGNLTLNLKAQRNGAGNGRVYTITVKCTDNGGNITTGTVNVVVPHDQGK
jgi:hypothetical protein